MSADTESKNQFENRKRQHLQWALSEGAQASSMSGFHRFQFYHRALPELNFSEVQLATQALGWQLKTPFLISSMTAGHPDAKDLNQRLADACATRGWIFGVGSQRRELTDPALASEWVSLRRRNSNLKILGNLGIAQVIQTPMAQVQRLVDGLQASAMIVHCNALQEVLQVEGTTDFRDGVAAISKLVQGLSVPVVLKEVGCGFDSFTLQRLWETGVAAIDLAGGGGTHWGRVEGLRAPPDSLQAKAAQTFANWGRSTFDCLVDAAKLKEARGGSLPFEVWASGGVRNGLDAAVCLGMGASVVGVAKPILESALISDISLDQKMEQFEFELRVVQFCTGSKTPQQLRSKGDFVC